MRGLVLACGPITAAMPRDVRIESVPSRPGKDDVDALLEPELVVAGTDADLAAVVLRLLRKDRLATTSVGYLPAEPSSVIARRYGLPGRQADALEVALTGTATEIPLVRNDAGGVLVGRGVVERVNGIAYCDDTVVLRGQARSVEVLPDSALGLAVTVTKGTFLPRRARIEGRAFQLACDPVVPESDGVPHPRPMERWTWYRHTDDLRLVLPKS